MGNGIILALWDHKVPALLTLFIYGFGPLRVFRVRAFPNESLLLFHVQFTIFTYRRPSRP